MLAKISRFTVCTHVDVDNDIVKTVDIINVVSMCSLDQYMLQPTYIMFNHVNCKGAFLMIDDLCVGGIAYPRSDNGLCRLHHKI
jgi:hypothetical protein